MDSGEAACQAFGKVIAQAWSDEDYKDRLLSDPRSVLAEAGIELEEGVEIKVVEEAPGVRHLVLPAPPADGQLSDEELSQIAGGNGWMSGGQAAMAESQALAMASLFNAMSS